MAKAIPFLYGQAQKYALKKTITYATGLDDFLGINPLNENEDVVMNSEDKILQQQKMFHSGLSKIIMMQ